MGVNLRDILPPKPIDLAVLSGKTLAVDANNTVYQFLSSIRQPDGTPLMDTKGRVTSHLSGFFYRTTRLLTMGIRPVYVFDGRPHPLKEREIARRRRTKAEATREWQKALDEGRTADAGKYAKRTSTFTDEMKEESFRLLEAMGVPAVQALGEGEAQCTHLCRKDASFWGVGSMDYDALLLGAPRLIRGLTLSGKIEPGVIELEESLASLGITREKLIELALLVGTDFNDGVAGIGPKKALAAVKNGEAHSFDLGVGLDELKAVFLDPAVTDDYQIRWGAPDLDGLVSLLVDGHDFSRNRIEKTVSELEKAHRQFTQQDLSRWM